MATLTTPLPQFTRPPVLLSAGVPSSEQDPKYLRTADVDAIRDAVTALATVVLPLTGIVFGGHPAITPQIGAVAQLLLSVAGRSCCSNQAGS